MNDNKDNKITDKSEKPATSLSSIQQQMLDGLLNKSKVHHQQNFIENEINASSKLSAYHHFSIYKNSYIMRLKQCMNSQFSALKYALGDELFHLFVEQYLLTHPSQHYSLNNLGDNFSFFLQQTRPDAQQDEKEQWPDFMIELADFEHNINRLFDIEVANTPLDHLQKQAKLSTPDQQLRLVPIIKLFKHKHPIFAYYRAFIDDKKPELALPKTSYGIMLRRNYRLGLIDLNYGQYLFIDTLLKVQDIKSTKQFLIKCYDFDPHQLDNNWQYWRKYFIEKGLFNDNK